MIILNFVQRKQRCAPPAEASFSRLPRMAQSAYIARAQALGIDPVSLFVSEQQCLLDKMNTPPVCCEHNLDNCTETTQSALTEEESAMAKIKRRIQVDGETKWICANSEQEYAQNVMQLMREKANESAGEKHNFRTYATDWFEVFSKPNIETATAVTYERQLRLHINPVLGDMSIEDVKPFDVQEMFNRMNGTKASKMKTKAVLNMIFEQAVEDKLIIRNPLSSRSIRITGDASNRTEPYTVEQMQTLCSGIPAIKNPQDRTYLVLQAVHPLRLEEVLGLKFEDIDRENLVIHVRRSVTHPERNQPEIKETKTAASRRDVALAKSAVQYLPCGPDDHFVLGGEKPLSCQQVSKMCERIRKDLAFDEKITPRRFRTTVLTDIYDSTKDIKQTQNAAGHTTAAMTLNHYVKGRSQTQDTASSISGLYGLT